jgi:hypothetical protein
MRWRPVQSRRALMEGRSGNARTRPASPPGAPCGPSSRSGLAAPRVHRHAATAGMPPSSASTESPLRARRGARCVGYQRLSVSSGRTAQRVGRIDKVACISLGRTNGDRAVGYAGRSRPVPPVAWDHCRAWPVYQLQLGYQGCKACPRDLTWQKPSSSARRASVVPMVHCSRCEAQRGAPLRCWLRASRAGVLPTAARTKSCTPGHPETPVEPRTDARARRPSAAALPLPSRSCGLSVPPAGREGPALLQVPAEYMVNSVITRPRGITQRRSVPMIAPLRDSKPPSVTRHPSAKPTIAPSPTPTGTL